MKASIENGRKSVWTVNTAREVKREKRNIFIRCFYNICDSFKSPFKFNGCPRVHVDDCMCVYMHLYVSMCLWISVLN